MKVLQVIPSIASIHGGPSKAIRVIEQSLKERGVDIETATTNDDGWGKHKVKHCGVALVEDSIKRWYFHKSCDYYKVSIDFYRWINTHITDYDVVHIHALFSFTSTVTAFAAIKNNVPYIIRPLGTLSTYGITQRRPFFKKLSILFFEKKMLCLASAIHFTSRAEQEEAETLNIPLRSRCIPLGVYGKEAVNNSLDIYEKYPTLRNKKVVLYLSRIDPKKNIENLIHAFSQCLLQRPDMCLLIVGSGKNTYVNELKKLAKILGVADCIIWAGFLDGEMKESAFESANLYVLPSLSENFGIAAAEALIRGVPCVVSYHVAISKQILSAKAGVVVDSSSNGIFNGIMKILNNAPYAKELSNNAKLLTTAEFSVEVMGDKLFQLYKEIGS